MMSVGIIATMVEMEAPMEPGITTAWHAMLWISVVVSLYLWRHLEDRTYLYYAGYVGMVGAMSLSNHVLAPWLWDRCGDQFIALNNFMHLPYAYLYLLFVRKFFGVTLERRGWFWFLRTVQWGYGLVFVWWAVGLMTHDTWGNEWGILFCNLTNLSGSLVLAMVAAYHGRAGAREFLYASFPLMVSGVVLVMQFLSGSGATEPSLLAFRSGFIMHVMIFLIALSVRYRDMQLDEARCSS